MQLGNPTSCTEFIDKRPSAEVLLRVYLEAARRRGLAICVVEWPGGEPIKIDLDVPIKVWKAFLTVRATIPLGASASLEEFAALPWASIVTVRCGEDWYPVIAGPARFTNDWVLPIIEYPDETDEIVDIEREAQRLRHYFGVAPRFS